MSQGNEDEGRLSEEYRRYYPETGFEERNEKIPWWMVLIYVSLAVWFVYYLFRYIY